MPISAITIGGCSDPILRPAISNSLIIDAPLLLETDLHTLCDAVIFVQASQEIRLSRVMESRGWDENELRRREEAQLPLDKKADSADYVIINESDHPIRSDISQPTPLNGHFSGVRISSFVGIKLNRDKIPAIKIEWQVVDR